MGGIDGLEVTRKILKQLTWSCTFYFIVMGRDNLTQISKEVGEKTSFDSKFKCKATLTTMQY